MATPSLLLTDIIEPGDSDKEGLYRNNDDVSLSFEDKTLNHKINIAIDNALPEIRRQLQQQLLAALSDK